LLRLHVLNVGHGDSLILERIRDDGRAFALIDSNKSATDASPALTKLRQLGADELSFVMLTHSHADHFTGMSAVLDAYQGKISAFYSFPVDRERKRLLAMASKVADAAKIDSKAVLEQKYELLRILLFANGMGHKWEMPCGPRSVIDGEGFDDVEFDIVNPPANEKGKLFESIDRGTYDPSDIRQNDLSLACLVTYRGHRLLLGGDATIANWRFAAARWSKRGLSSPLGCSASKLPHHGSRIDSADTVLDSIFAGAEPDHSTRFALISADGSSHPHADVLRALRARGIKPYCTNLARMCGGGTLKRLIPTDGLDPRFARYINSSEFAEARAESNACQGEICLEISDSGELNVRRQFDVACPVRGEVDLVFATP